ncbi:MAG: MFS transporter [Candidatus Nanopelagicales bacterium]
MLPPSAATCPLRTASCRKQCHRLTCRRRISWSRLAANTALIGGAAAGGLLVAAIGPGWTLAVDALSYLVVAIFRRWIRLPALAPHATPGYLTELRHGWREFTGHRWLWLIVAQFSLVNTLFLGCFTVLGPVVADESLNGPGSWGAVLAGQALGAAAGAILIMRVRPNRPLLVGALGTACLALPILALAGPLPTLTIVIAAGLSGIGVEVFTISWSTTLQERIPTDRLSRVAAYDAVGSYALSPLGAIAAGPVSAHIGIPATLTAGGLAILGLSVGAVGFRQIRQLRVVGPRTREGPAAEAPPVTQSSARAREARGADSRVR